MAKRELIRGGKSVACEHPAGGVYFIRPLPTKELLRYREELKAKGIEVTGDETSGVTVSKRSDVEDSQEFIDYVKTFVDRVADFVDAGTQEEIPSSPEFIDELLWHILESEAGKKKLVAAWVLDQAIELGNGRKKAEVKN